MSSTRPPIITEHSCHVTVARGLDARRLAKLNARPLQELRALLRRTM
jgi:hypothetical protein